MTLIVALVALAVSVWAWWASRKAEIACKKTDVILTRLEEDGLSAHAKIRLAYHLWGLGLITTNERRERCLRILDDDAGATPNKVRASYGLPPLDA